MNGGTSRAIDLISYNLRDNYLRESFPIFSNLPSIKKKSVFIKFSGVNRWDSPGPYLAASKAKKIIP